jgi:hypothetical protein
VAVLAALVARAGEDEQRGARLAPLVRKEDRAPLERAAVLLVLADEITERCAPGTPLGVHCARRVGEVVVRVRGLLSWGVRGLGERFEAAFGRGLRVVPEPGRRRGR